MTATDEAKAAVEEAADLAARLLQRFREGRGLDDEAMRLIAQMRAEIEAAECAAYQHQRKEMQ